MNVARRVLYALLTPALCALLVWPAARAKAADYDSSHQLYSVDDYSADVRDATRGHITAALHRLDARLADDPHNGSLRVRRGIVLVYAAEPDAAVSEFRIVAGMRPEDAIIHSLLGWALLMGGQTDQSEAEFLQAVQMTRPQANAGTFALLSLALEKKGSNKESVDALVNALQASPPEDAWEFLAGRCDVAARIGLLESAQEACDDSIAKHARNEVALAGRGLLEIKTKQYARADADFSQALYFAPNNIFALYGRGIAKQAAGDAAGAAADIQSAVRQEPQIVQIMARLGVVPGH